jgi:hypothetical protein
VAKIEVIGWVMNWRYQSDEPNPEWAMKLSESHSKQNESGGLEVKSYTNWTVKAGYNVSLDFRKFKKGDRVRVIGTQLTEERGEYKNLVIKATSVEVLEAPKAVDDSVPF